MEPVPDYGDLIWLFEDEPVNDYGDGLDWREDWPYASVMFRTIRAGYRVEMGIQPSHDRVRLSLHTDPEGAELLSLDLRGVQTVEVRRDHGRELLKIDFPEGSEAATLWLRLKPDVAVHWAYGRLP